MAQGIYKSGQQINLTYQAVGALSNAIPVSKIYDEANASDVAKQTVLDSALLAGEKAGGRYLGYFTPDAEGKWTVCIQDKNGDGLVSKTYEVCGHNIDEVGDDAVTAKNNADSAANAAQSALAKASSALAQADSAANAAQSAAGYGASAATSAGAAAAANASTSALAKATSALAQADSAANAAQSALAKATSALAQADSAANAAQSAAGYASSAATSAGVAAIGSPAMVS